MGQLKQFELADIWADALDEARKNALEAEIIQTAFNRLEICKEELEEALAYAFAEWDI